MASLTKKQKSLAEKLGDNQKLYGIDEAIQALKDLKTTKFDETLEIALNLGVDPRHADQMVRGMVTLPSGTGKDVKVAVFARGDNAEKALAAGADKVGAEDLLEDMQAGKRSDRVPRREGRDHPWRHRQALVLERCAQGQCRCFPRCHRQGQAIGRQGQVSQEDRPDLVDGSRPQDRRCPGAGRIIRASCEKVGTGFSQKRCDNKESEWTK